MRSMLNPVQNGSAMFLTCVSSLSNEPMKASFNQISWQIAIMWADYHAKAAAGNLYELAPDRNPAISIYLGVASKQAFNDLYTQQMVGASKPARAVYDALIASAPKGKCPYCGYGQAKTLDHFLPKASFPQYAVYPSNLIPACSDCNKGKSSGVARTKQEQCIHPYYDSHLVADQWLFAEVSEESPVALSYFVRPPNAWDPIDRDRIFTHFRDFDLAKRFTIEAADELSTIRDTIVRMYPQGDAEQIKQLLIGEATSRYRNHKNSWQTALYQALGESDWFCRGGYTLE